MKQQFVTLLLVGFSGVVLAQGAQQGGAQQGAQPRQPQGAQAQPSQVPSFETADKNKDGQLSRAEAGGVDGLDFTKADINQNASIDRQEYTAAMASGQRP